MISSRTALLLGDDALLRISSARVLVAGLGGVGSYAAEALARAGVGHLTIIDSDIVNESNINRQIHALTSTVGRPKTVVMAERMQQINPSIQIDAIQKLITPENLSEFQISSHVLVLDAIDSFSAKLALIKQCVEHQVPVISSMGAAARLDPGMVKTDDISKSHGCRLARKLRKELRRTGISSGVTVVYSDEQSMVERLGEAGDGNDSRRHLGSISYLPAIFGLFMSAEAIKRILDR